MSSDNGNNPPPPPAAAAATGVNQTAFTAVNNNSIGLDSGAQVPPLLSSHQQQTAGVGTSVSFATPAATAMPPPLPPVPPGIINTTVANTTAASTNSTVNTWQCTCGNTCLPSKKRCGSCHKWRDGKRGPLQKKKTNNNDGTNAYTPTASATPARNPPTLEVQLPTPRSEASRLSSISPLTTGRGGVDDLSSIRSGGSSTVTAAIETNENIREMALADYNATGDGGDSDDEGDGFDVAESMAESTSTRERVVNDHDEIEANVMDSIDNCHHSNEEVILPGFADLEGAPEGWNPPQPNERYDPSAALGPGEPSHSTIDNPGNWSKFTFRAKFDGSGESKRYKGHEMPAGAIPVPKNSEGKRVNKGYEFFYGSWKHPQDDARFYRAGATKDNLFPPDRFCELDGELLKKMGLTRKRMQEGDALFFQQLLTPFCDPSKSGIDGDPRKGFYCDVSDYTGSYAMSKKKLSGNYGNKFVCPTAEELVNFDGIVIKNKNDFIGDSWLTDNSHTYDPLIAETMYFRRWLDIKSNLKLCDFMKEKDKTDPDYDPTQKYRLIWDVTVYNLNQIIKKGGKDVVIDETTWANMSYADVQSVVQGKPGVSRGGQHAVLVDRQHRYIYAYVPRHSWIKREHPFTQQGPAEVKLLLDECEPLIKGATKDDGDTRRQIFDEKFHATMDNHFSGDILDYMGLNGYKAICTNRRNRLPTESKYLHYKKDTPINHRSKVARYENPIIAVKHTDPPAGSGKHPYTRVHVSFQSTGPCNISSVNSLQEVNLYVRKKERGRGNKKRVWGIEMNEGRDLYLQSYSSIDKIDQLLKNWNEFYICWKWWHAPTRHGKAFSKCMAYELYKHCASGSVDPDWKVDNPLSAKGFRQKMATQMCNYRARNMLYPGDEKFRNTTKTPKKRRGVKRSHDTANDETTADNSEVETTGVTYAQYLDAKHPRGRGGVKRLCVNDMANLRKHLDSCEPVKSRKTCEVCGQQVFRVCKLCGKPMHLETGKVCAVDFHDDDFFGLARSDFTDLLGGTKSQWKPPTTAERSLNKKHIAQFKRRMEDDDMDVDD